MKRIEKEVIPYENEETAAPATQKTAYTLLTGLLFIVGPGFVGVIASGLFEYYAGDLAAASAPTRFVSLGFRFGGTWLAVLLYVVMVERRPLASLGLTKVPVANLWAWLMFVILIARGVAGRSAAWLLAGRFIQAGAEELLYRGWLFIRVTETTGRNDPGIGLVANATLFTLAHLLNPGLNYLSIANLIVFSVLMSGLVRRQGHLWGAITIHTVWNWSNDTF